MRAAKGGGGAADRRRLLDRLAGANARPTRHPVSEAIPGRRYSQVISPECWTERVRVLFRDVSDPKSMVRSVRSRSENCYQCSEFHGTRRGENVRLLGLLAGATTVSAATSSSACAR